MPVSDAESTSSSPEVVAQPSADDNILPLALTDLKLEVDRIQYRWNSGNNCYEVSPDSGGDGTEASDDPKNFAPTHAFVFARKFKPTNNPDVFSITKKLHVWSPYFTRSAREVMECYAHIAWGSKPLKLDPEQLLAFLPNFEAYLRKLEEDPEKDTDKYRKETIRHVNFFIKLMKKEYASRLETLASLLSEKQITFGFVWGVFTPGSILLTHCDTTGEPLALRLISCTLARGWNGPHWELLCENAEVSSGLPGFSDFTLEIPEFVGAESIMDLPAFPMDPYLEETYRKELVCSLIHRGKRYWELSETWCHKDYDGVARSSSRKIALKSRVMLDRENYARYANDGIPSVQRDLDGKSTERKALNNKNVRRSEMTDEEFMLLPAKMYGFSLSDRKWMTFNVEFVKDIQWNLEAFDRLDISLPKKDIVKVLIESHTQKVAEFDDFIPGKGRGLIFALHGPPGVGKTLTAEATSEVARAPLYMVGAGDLGTTANELDNALTTLFDLAAHWKAIVLIDEADVFLERRDVHDLLRNAMVAVFLRQLEYYVGILILTTNRLSIIDPAMKSRIHVSLHYEPLNIETRKRLWRAFLGKAGVDDGASKDIDPTLMNELCLRALNGREIKNVIKTATTYAAYHGRPVNIDDILKVVHTVDDMGELEF